MPDKPEEQKDKAVEESKPAPQDQIVEAQHTVTIGGKEISYTVTTGTLVLKEESEKTGDKAGEAEGEKPKASMFFVAYTRNDVEDKATAPDHVLLQRRAGIVVGLAASGRAGAAPRADGRRRQSAAAALSADGQRLFAPGRDRSRLHRSDVHRLQPRRRRRESQRVSQLQERHRIGRRFHPPVHHALSTLAVAQVPDRRELRHDARRRAERLSAGTARPVFQRHHAGLVDPRFRHGRFSSRQRSAVHSLSAHLRGHGLVSPAA